MPYGSWINELPTGFFLVVHITGLFRLPSRLRSRHRAAGPFVAGGERHSAGEMESRAARKWVRCPMAAFGAGWQS
jgi:hypothetical protein